MRNRVVVRVYGGLWIVWDKSLLALVSQGISCKGNKAFTFFPTPFPTPVYDVRAIVHFSRRKNSEEPEKDSRDLGVVAFPSCNLE